jgi:hypothetical protein
MSLLTEEVNKLVGCLMGQWDLTRRRADTKGIVPAVEIAYVKLAQLAHFESI